MLVLQLIDKHLKRYVNEVIWLQFVPYAGCAPFNQFLDPPLHTQDHNHSSGGTSYYRHGKTKQFRSGVH